MAFIQNEQVGCAILEGKGEIKHKGKGNNSFHYLQNMLTMVCISCKRGEVKPAEDENENAPAIGVDMLENTNW